MELKSFRILNFRSIADSQWRRLSPDNVTVLIGQNESGKTSVLEALSVTLAGKSISDDDKRIGEPTPKVHIRVKLNDKDISEVAQYLQDEGYAESYIKAAEAYLKAKPDEVEMHFQWALGGTPPKYEKIITIVADDLEEQLRAIFKAESEKLEQEAAVAAAAPQAAPPKPVNAAVAVTTQVVPAKPSQPQPKPQSTPTPAPAPVVAPKVLDTNGVADAIYQVAPTISLFEHETGLLPSQIDIGQDKAGKPVLTGTGSVAAQNFLTVAGLNLEELVTSDPRTRANLLAKADDKITRDFLTFWTQTIGRKDQLKLQCELQTYDADAGADKVGKKYLQFWVSDKLNKLYPKQRSQGVRWFVSFYLQLKASESTARIFLLDEPGANLHSKAQTDVKKLITDLSKDVPIVYSTHIPDMLDYDKQFRILAVQRVGELDDSPTEIKPAHELGTASTDTLTPLLMAMGADFSSQGVVKKENNVLLEEISGFYYLKAFWKLTGQTKKAYFIAATGVNKLPAFANMFLGWGLGYIVVVDDDKSGRGVYNSLKTDLFADDDALAKKNMYKIKDCDGIEDVFSANDFKTHVLNDTTATITEGNNAYLKTANFSKPVLAHTFMLKVEKGDITLGTLDAPTQAKIKDVVQEISSRLA